MSVSSLVLETAAALDRLQVPYAFGGALALAYYAEPRATLDVDVNVFAPFHDGPDIVGRMAVAGLEPERPPPEWLPLAGVRLTREGERAKLDVFFSVDDSYAEVASRVRRFPFGTGGDRLPFLSADDLIVFKLSFGRDKDWTDITAMLAGGHHLDLAYVERQLLHLRGPAMHPRLARLRQLARDVC